MPRTGVMEDKAMTPCPLETTTWPLETTTGSSSTPQTHGKHSNQTSPTGHAWRWPDLGSLKYKAGTDRCYRRLATRGRKGGSISKLWPQTLCCTLWSPHDYCERRTSLTLPVSIFPNDNLLPTQQSSTSTSTSTLLRWSERAWAYYKYSYVDITTILLEPDETPLVGEHTTSPKSSGQVECGGIDDTRNGKRSPSHSAQSNQEMGKRNCGSWNDLHHEGRDVVHEKNACWKKFSRIRRRRKNAKGQTRTCGVTIWSTKEHVGDTPTKGNELVS